MNNIYVIPKDSIFEVFDDIEKFIKRMELFQEGMPQYQYELKIRKKQDNNMKWELRAKIWKDEQNNNNISEKVINPFGVL